MLCHRTMLYYTMSQSGFFSKSALNTASRKRPNPYIFGNAEITILDPIRFRTDNLYQWTRHLLASDIAQERCSKYQSTLFDLILNDFEH